MKTYKTIKELPNIPVETEFKYNEAISGSGMKGVTLTKGDNIGGLLDFIRGFGIDCGYFEEVKPKSYKRWRAYEYDSYWYINTDGKLHWTLDQRDEEDNKRYAMGNYYQTQEEATFARDRQIFITKVNDRIMELNEGWVMNYKNRDNKYILKGIGNKIEIQEVVASNFGIVISACFSYEIANQIIKEFHDDLQKYIFN